MDAMGGIALMDKIRRMASENAIYECTDEAECVAKWAN